MCKLTLDNNISKNNIHMNGTTKQKISSSKVTLKYGNFSKVYKVIEDNALSTDEIKMNGQITKRLTFPTIPLTIMIRENSINIGPVIGYLTTKQYCKDPSLLISRFSGASIDGLVYIFHKNSVNKKEKTIKGLYFDKETKTFKKGVFPYPSVVYNRSNRIRSLYRHFKKEIGDNFFNYPFRINKWRLWRYMENHTSIVKHLPYTEKYNSSEQLDILLNKYKNLYLKPTNLSKGRGILYIQKNKSGYTVTNRFNKTINIKNKLELEKYLNKNIKRKYIIQEEIPFQYKDNKMDFRIYIQKDESKNWRYTGGEAKVGKKGTIVTNSRYREKILTAKEALTNVFKMSDNKANKKLKEISKLCISMLKVIENKGYTIGDSAIDLIIDNNQNVKILEVQLNYRADAKALRTEDEQRVLPFILPTPLKYAKKLAGF
ncbi:YheC/YheD family protein [Evansella cellulosilytica]|uniref:ATP-grasp domain-containing protein n=1 Tax=Evansella cellulosilytica (strain ATCC 21833 / DSM 2522 / FERM P-1141 / JCM 9156 / N-4) TaxID=649639 RepID=E6TWB6_EVAC2|nr:YheC/YheD family protein [Evansella cellulosilytica]ADU31072.1 hypothetical protein Bcell_2819 [Evansella cellulosilytica DSM 2522]